MLAANEVFDALLEWSGVEMLGTVDVEERLIGRPALCLPMGSNASPVMAGTHLVRKDCQSASQAIFDFC